MGEELRRCQMIDPITAAVIFGAFACGLKKKLSQNIVWNEEAKRWQDLETGQFVKGPDGN
jgi:hypothetical protein